MDTPTLRPPRHRVSRTAIWYWAARAALGWLVVLAAQALWLVADRDGTALSVDAHVIGLVVTAVVAVAHVAIMPQWRYRVHRWEATSAAVFTQSGWFKQEWRIAPVSRIQTVDSERGPLERIFHLANVTVTTASAAGPIKVSGLDRDTARRLVAELTASAQATAGDAT
ncbi:membrane protein [Microbispora rosea subsp. aerata]|nr:PH domain-containing protein [Microbispora rosea]GGO14726.1 membrane protein [Microbispora rosea subsp. aerata]GIH55583.1 membrane protein [Microbispora rosea subsp. aerata]GLJ86575.1 membrane protein [Microbispora rosea subsp. aerata]